MNVFKPVSISAKDLHQLLVTACRYGCTVLTEKALKHAIDLITKNIDLLYQVDSKLAIETLKVLTLDCINVLHGNFNNGVDDRFSNRQRTIEFIEWCLDFIHKDFPEYFPHNYNLYTENIERSKSLLYKLYERTDNGDILLNEASLTDQECFEYMYKDASGGIDNTEITFNKTIISCAEADDQNNIVHKIDYVFEIKTPIVKTFFMKHDY